jgi:hypothetical protein
LAVVIGSKGRFGDMFACKERRIDMKAGFCGDRGLYTGGNQFVDL